MMNYNNYNNYKLLYSRTALTSTSTKLSLLKSCNLCVQSGVQELSFSKQVDNQILSYEKPTCNLNIHKARIIFGYFELENIQLCLSYNLVSFCCYALPCIIKSLLLWECVTLNGYFNTISTNALRNMAITVNNFRLISLYVSGKFTEIIIKDRRQLQSYLMPLEYENGIMSKR